LRSKTSKSTEFTSGDLNQIMGTRAMRSIGWGGRQQVIYKHAISTIAPQRPIDLTE
jgi:hypothetical protein